MALIFSSGGGRLGNQLLNLIHLNAIYFEHNIELYKINDLFITGKNRSFIFRILRKNTTWEVVNNSTKQNILNKLFLKILIRLLHLSYFVLPYKRSYKIGPESNIPKFIVGTPCQISFFNELIKESNKFNVIISGWGLRNWDLVLKHKKSIVKNIQCGLAPILNINKSLLNDYLFVHIRRSDFLDIDEYNDLNFSDEEWLKSILKICNIEDINKVVIFSDSDIKTKMISYLKSRKIEVNLPNPELNQNKSFLELFVSYLYHAKAVICNGSSLSLSMSFLFHEKIYLPSKKLDFQNINLNNAHNSYPTSLNWN